SEAPVTCRETDGVYDCIQKMKQAKVRRIPVVNGSEEVVGILSFGDLLSMLSREFSELVSTTTRDEEYRSQERKIA
ncbi:MAG TPA: CBS domain-containing protein, partial [Bdellovibrionales bacterium]|nr:CBS domain-containing protein [Bdellovibrionales bacterium]